MGARSVHSPQLGSQNIAWGRGWQTGETVGIQSAEGPSSSLECGGGHR